MENNSNTLAEFMKPKTINCDDGDTVLITKSFSIDNSEYYAETGFRDSKLSVFTEKKRFRGEKLIVEAYIQTQYDKDNGKEAGAEEIYLQPKVMDMERWYIFQRFAKFNDENDEPADIYHFKGFVAGMGQDTYITKKNYLKAKKLILKLFTQKEYDFYKLLNWLNDSNNKEFVKWAKNWDKIAMETVTDKGKAFVKRPSTHK